METMRLKRLLAPLRIGAMRHWLRRLVRLSGRPTATRPAPIRGNSRHAGGKLADVADLIDPAFGASLRNRLANVSAVTNPRKLWEFFWLAQQFDELGLAGGTCLGLGVGRELMIHHFAHLAQAVVATDLYATDSVWLSSRSTIEAIYDASPFPYPRERVTVCNMDMRRLDFPADAFDLVWSTSSVEHVDTLPQLVGIFREIHRVLRPGGVALITTEYSLGEPYFLPGVLSLWSDCALFRQSLQGLTLLGSVALHERSTAPGNQPTLRRLAQRLPMLYDYQGGPTGLCIHLGYTQSVPIGLAFRKTQAKFAWPELLGAPTWYAAFAAGVATGLTDGKAEQAAHHFRQALQLAESPGAQLHCYRYLIEALVHAGGVAELSKLLAECAQRVAAFPEDDDALGLIGYVAAGQGCLPLARRCWEKAHDSPSALPVSRLTIRLNQLEAELNASGMSQESRHLLHLSEAARWEALDFHGPNDPVLQQLEERYRQIRQRYQLVLPGSTAAAWCGR